ncbi:HET-domain-containing protein [Stipitochalara longipes BDJ]|nr:HET-domain-containing protein [Stipitochalara longipes BDJ]
MSSNTSFFPADSSYQYEKLTEPDALRLVLLLPSEDVQSPLRCNLIRTTLSKCENDLLDHYTALSYVWGDASRKVPIKVAGETISITASLDTALRHLRDPLRIRRIWADAICINQNDFEERNQQVRQMASVYAIAQHTVIWIGEGTAETDGLFGTLKLLASERLQGRSTMASQATVVSEQIRLSASQSVLARQWFRRVWVLQELVRSRDPWVQCGKFLVKWQDLKNVITTSAQDIGVEKVQVIEDMGNLHTEHHLSRFRSRIRHESDDAVSVARKLLTLLISRRALGVQDPRDRLFAHVGLLGSVSLDKSLLRLIEVDYGKEEGLVFFEIAQFLTEAFGDYRILPLLEYGHATNSTHLPSWVPDWSLENPPEFETLSSALKLQDETSAAYFPPNPRCLNFWVPEFRVLASGGWSVAIIQNLCSGEVCLHLRNPKSKAIFDSLKKQVLRNTKFHCKVKELLSLLATGFTESYEKLQQVLKRSDTPDPSKVLTTIASHLEGPEEPYDPQSFLKASGLFKSRIEVAQAEETMRQGIQAVCDYLTEELLPQKQVALFGGLQSTSKSGTYSFESQSLLAHLTMLGFGKEAKNMFCYRKLATLKDGTPALVPDSTQPGDIVAILMRHAIPLILRPIEIEEPKLEENIRAQIIKNGYNYLKRKKIEHFRVIGECFVEGLMHGEAYKKYKADLSKQPRVLALH